MRHTQSCNVQLFSCYLCKNTMARGEGGSAFDCESETARVVETEQERTKHDGRPAVSCETAI